MTELHIATDWPVTDDFIDVLRAIQSEDFPMITKMRVLEEDDMFSFDGEILVLGNPKVILEEYGVDVGRHPHVLAPSIKETFWTAGGATKLRYALSRIVSGVSQTHEEIPYTVIYPGDAVPSMGLHGRAFVDIEVSGDIKTEGPETSELISVGVRANGQTIVFSREALREWKYRRALVCIMMDNEIVLHNGSFDCRWLNYHLADATMGENGHQFYTDDDTMLMHHSMFHGAGEHGLKQLCQRIFGAPEWEADAKKYTKAGAHYELIPPHLLYRYNAGDVYWTEQLYLYLRTLMSTRPDAQKCYRETELPASHMLQDITRFGMPVDLEYATELDTLLQQQIELAQDRLNLFGGKEVDVVNKRTGAVTQKFVPFNANSPKQVKEWFTEHDERTMSSTDEKHLMSMHIRGRHMGMIEAILEYRGNSKARSTYVTGVLAKVDEHARVHPTFKVHGTSTGRLASSGPNIQNVSNDVEGKPSLRRMYRTHTEETVFVGCDYAQAELRVMAELSNDLRMIGDLQLDSPDFFTNMLPDVFPQEDFTVMSPKAMKKFRLKLKRVVYGSSYGLTAGSVASMLTLEGSPTTPQEAQAIQDGYLGIYPGLRYWREHTMQDNRDTNLLTPFGRQLQLDVITDATYNRARNQAWAFKPQSIASDICVHAALHLHKHVLPVYGAHLVASVHDALYVESPVNFAIEVQMEVEKAMSASAAHVYTRVPFPADGHISRNWNEC